MLRDRMTPARHDRDGNDMLLKGLYFDEPEWAVHVFQIVAA